MNRYLRFLTALSGIIVLTALTPMSASSSLAVTTTVRFFQPYLASGLSSAATVAGAGSGYCWTGSDQVPDPNAYRCLKGNEILDPCFASPFAKHVTTVACGDPWTGVFLLRLTKALPVSAPDEEVYPQAGWLLELANGSRCRLADGATGSVDGIRVAYLCGSSTVAGQLLWSSQPWHVEYIGKGAKRPSRESVVVAWGA